MSGETDTAGNPLRDLASRGTKTHALKRRSVINRTEPTTRCGLPAGFVGGVPYGATISADPTCARCKAGKS